VNVGGDAAVFVPRKPAVAEVPAVRVLFHEAAWIIAVGPLCIEVPFQAWVTVAPDGRVHWTYQPLSGDGPLFLIVTSPWKPPCHELTSFTVAVQSVTGSVDVEVTVGETVGVTVGVTDGVTLGVAVGVVPPVKFTSEQP
jgi:hypothetical protein